MCTLQVGTTARSTHRLYRSATMHHATCVALLIFLSARNGDANSAHVGQQLYKYRSQLCFASEEKYHPERALASPWQAPSPPGRSETGRTKNCTLESHSSSNERHEEQRKQDPYIAGDVHHYA